MRQKHFSPKSAKNKRAIGKIKKAGASQPKSRGKPGKGVTEVDRGELYQLFQHLLVMERKNSGMSQQEVADRLGRPQTYVSKCELGTRRMDIVEFLEIADVIGFDPQTLIKRLKSV
jgi:ribosome-binding protein aMBF1 (putative translation factor)